MIKPGEENNLFYVIYYTLKLILSVKEATPELYAFSIEVSNNLVKLMNASNLKRDNAFKMELISLCKKLLLATNGDFKNYKYLLCQNIDFFLK